MKKYLVLPIFIGLVFSVMFSGCKKKADGTPANPLMTAKVAGETWTTTFRTTTLISNVFTITGQVGLTLDKLMLITIKGATAKTYKLSTVPLLAECAIVYKKTANASESDAANYFTSISAEITITSVDMVNKLISGTFRATLSPTSTMLTNFADDIEITDGKFQDLAWYN